MSQSLFPNLMSLLGQHFELRKSRLETLSVLVFGLVVSRSCNLAILASNFESQALVASSYRRLQRFFQAIKLDQSASAKLIFAKLAPSGKATLSLDRTNWKFGTRNINVLVLALTTRRISIPLLWRTMDRAGNSDQDLRQELLSEYLELFGVNSIKQLLADREFIGSQWLDFLCENGVPFIIRLREDLRFHQPNGHQLPFRNLIHSRHRIYQWQGRLTGQKHQIWAVAKTLKSGENLILLTNMDKPKAAFEQYKKRWRIECMFANTKTRGFNLEDTHLSDPQKIKTLLVIVSLACLWAYSVANDRLGRHNPKTKSHGRRAKTIFKVGLENLRKLILHQHQKACDTMHRAFELEPVKSI